MQIQVIANGNSGTPLDRLCAVTGEHQRNDSGYPIVYASAYAEGGLVAILEVRALRGEREILVMECNAQQIQAVLVWQSDTKEDIEDLVLHLVRNIQFNTEDF